MSPSSTNDRPPQGFAGFGDLGTRVVSATVLIALALGASILGGEAFALFWMIAAFAVDWEWQGLLGGRRRFPQIFFGGVAVAAAAGLTNGGAPGAGLAALFLFAGVCAVLAGPALRAWAFAGVVYSGSLVICVALLRELRASRLARDGLAICGRLGFGCFRLFRRSAHRRPEALATCFGGKDLVWNALGLLAGALLGSLIAAVGTKGAASEAPVFLVSAVASALSQVGDLRNRSSSAASG